MPTITRTYGIRSIAPDVVAGLRVVDDAGQPPRRVSDHDGGGPLRCCLRAAHPGEPLLLVAYAPLRRWAEQFAADPGPYDEVGPVFIHAQPCDGYAGSSYPDDLRGVHRMMRAYRADGSILDGRLVAADEQPEQILDVLFADPQVAVVHARAIEFGCFTFEVRRA